MVDLSARARAVLHHIVTTCTDRFSGPSPLRRDLSERRARAESDGKSAVAAPEPLSLGYGYPGLALLFAELGRDDERFTKLADACLGAAAAQSAAPAWNGLFSGYAAVAFACRAIENDGVRYAGVLDRLDRAIGQLAENSITLCRAARESGGNNLQFHHYDLVSGLVGLGRYFLLDGVDRPDELSGILAEVVELSRPVARDGVRLPGWWVGHHPSLAVDGSRHGHCNLGMSHGIAGCLALLAVARLGGHRVPGQDEAIGRMMSFLTAWRQADEFGFHWPEYLLREQYLGEAATTTTSPSNGWCYGASGIARAVQLAGLALGDEGWLHMARTAAGGVVARLDRAYALGGPQLCHGWAGVLHSLRRLNDTLADPAIEAGVQRILGKILDAYDPGLPLGFRTRPEYPNGADDPGFLNGAAGIGLAIHSYLRGTAPAGRWDATLLLC